MNFPFVGQNYNRTGSPRIRCVNMIAEQGPFGLQGRQRPGLLFRYDLDDDPVRLIVNFASTTYALTGTNFWGLPFPNSLPDTPDLIDTVAPGGFYPQAAFSEEQLVISSGNNAYTLERSDPDHLTQNTSPNLPSSLNGVAFLGGRFVYTSYLAGTYYYSEINQAGVINGLNFASTESHPDNIIRPMTLDDELLFFCTNTVERHFLTTDPDAPFERAQGRSYNIGCVAPGSIVRADNAIYFMGGQARTGCSIYRTGAVPIKVSDETVDAAIAAYALSFPYNLDNITACHLVAEGHEYYVLNIPGVCTFALDISNGRWTEWQRYGRTTFDISQADEFFVGDSTTGTIYQVVPDRSKDGDDPIIRVAGFHIKTDGLIDCDNLTMVGAMGTAGPGVTFEVEMRYTDGGDGDWTTWRARSMGAEGQTRKRAPFRRLGQIHPPGRIVEWRWSGDAIASLWYMKMNQRP